MSHPHHLLALLMGVFTSMAASAYTAPEGYQVTQGLALATSAVFNPSTKTILATMPSSAGMPLGNTVTELTLSGEILRSTFIGSEPTTIALSSDGSTAYIGMAGASLVRRYDVASGTAGSVLPLPPADGGSNYALEIEVSPVDKDTIVVRTRDDLIAYSGGKLLPDVLDVGAGSITFGGDGSTLYGYENGNSFFTLFTFDLDANGLEVRSELPHAFWGYNHVIDYDDGLIYKSSGEVFDPVAQAQVGMYQDVVAVLPDSAAGVVYGFSSSNQLVVFDQDTFLPLAKYATNLAPWGSVQLLNLGEGNLGLLASTDGVHRNLYFLQAIPEPSTLMFSCLGGLLLFLRVKSLRRSQG